MNGHARSLYTAKSAYELERRAREDHGIPGYTLMQRAAAAVWEGIGDRWPHAKSIVVLCGDGNNGGDGYEVACQAHHAGRSVTVYSISGAPSSGDAAEAERAWRRRGAVEVWHDQCASAIAECDVIVDAIFGIGLSRPAEGAARSAILAVNRAATLGTGVVAVDIPSGLRADTGTTDGAVISADLTVTFIGRKAGLHTAQGPARTGAVIFNDLGIPVSTYEGVPSIARLLDGEEIASALPPRSRAAHKGANGHVLVVGGGRGTAGAALLAARAALRVGAGLVSVGTHQEHVSALVAAQPELMCRGIEGGSELETMIDRASVVAVGPGLGQDAWARAVFVEVCKSGKPLVIDADALNLLATIRPRPVMPSQGWVLTPHPGEAGRLLGISTKDVETDRYAAVRDIQNQFGGSAVLKGAGSLVIGQDLSVCPYGNPGMATGGMGDALTGVIAGLAAQGLGLDEAAVVGTLVHARAGDLAAAAGERGLIPSDLIDQIRNVVNP